LLRDHGCTFDDVFHEALANGDGTGFTVRWFIVMREHMGKSWSCIVTVKRRIYPVQERERIFIELLEMNDELEVYRLVC
jgi:hypothetical protein